MTSAFDADGRHHRFTPAEVRQLGSAITVSEQRVIRFRGRLGSRACTKTMVHPTSDPERFGKLVDGVRKHCPGMVIQLSTGGRPAPGASAVA